MKVALTSLLTVFALCVAAYAGDSKSVGLDCEKAIVKAEILAAHRKWWPERPDPKGPVLNIRTHANYAKDFLLPLGPVFSHEKVGELTFEEQNGECLVESNGHPADVVLDDLVKNSASSRTVKAKGKTLDACETDNDRSMLDCHGRVKTATNAH